MYDARQIANWFIARAMQDQKPVTIMKLLKLVYVSHGWYLEMVGAPLIRNRIEAWKYGPVIPDVYSVFSGSGASPIGNVLPGYDSTGLDDFTQKFLEQIYNLYGNKSAIELSNMTHETGGPWDIASRRNGYFAPIDNETIVQHYRLKRQAATG
ncbi:Panacea domain-containing protein [Roseibium litorale]|uniref:SocA family protein n=1 Tax=Roseibium litorale TaxID=2803841 RepID=A0ABR9CLR2_9HYPH|nr:type II toxin-antitoxin system antitoxin SocA domain-containing protein [Roseibium litorale]MBD8891800.1 SocA family protein [Roseibium litorale]